MEILYIFMLVLTGLYNESSLIRYKYLVTFGFVLVRTMEQQSHCLYALKQITEVRLRAAAMYHANEGVLVK